MKLSYSLFQTANKLASYSEEGFVTHHGELYSLKNLFTLAENKPIQQLEVNLLSWILAYDQAKQERVEKADLGMPIIVVKEGEEWFVLDGLHRVAKAVELGIDFIPGRILTETEIKSAKIT